MKCVLRVIFCWAISSALYTCSDNPVLKSTQPVIQGPAKDSLIDEPQRKGDTMTPGKLKVCINGGEDPKGSYVISIYQEEDIFLQRSNLYRELIFSPEEGDLCTHAEIPYGLYAIAVFNDKNNNDILDKNVIGMPAEDYGFSTLKGAVHKVPHFKDCVFEFSKTNNRCVIEMQSAR